MTTTKFNYFTTITAKSTSSTETAVLNQGWHRLCLLHSKEEPVVFVTTKKMEGREEDDDDVRVLCLELFLCSV